MSVVPLSEIATVVRGVSFDKGEVVDEGRDGFLPILRAGNIESDLQLDQDLVWVPAARVAPEQRMRLHDIAICMSSGSQAVVGKTAPLRREWDGSVGAFCALIRPQADRVVPAYLSYFLKSERFREWTRQSTGANIKNIRKTELESFLVPRVTLDDQRGIVDLLSRAEGIVRLRREAQRKAQAITSAIFLEIFGDPALNLKGWEIVALGSVAQVQGGLQVTHAREGLPLERPYLRVANVHRDRLELSEIKTIRLLEQELERTRLREGDLLIVEGHGNPQEIGRVAIWDATIPECVHQNHLIRVRLRADRLLPVFASAYLNSESGRMSLLRAGKTTSGLSTISVKNVASATITLPPLVDQQLFTERAAALRSVTAHQARALSKAQALFSSLLAQVFHQIESAPTQRERVRA